MEVCFGRFWRLLHYPTSNKDISRNLSSSCSPSFSALEMLTLWKGQGLTIINCFWSYFQFRNCSSLWKVSKSFLILLALVVCSAGYPMALLKVILSQIERGLSQDYRSTVRNVDIHAFWCTKLLDKLEVRLWLGRSKQIAWGTVLWCYLV